MSAAPQPLTAEDLADAQWRKPRASGTNGSGCFEFARIQTPDGPAIALRDSKDPDGPVLRYTVHELRCLIDGVKGGEFDDMAV
jgi:hypothetical protein